jgi:diguanylate cyclase (GGDEF)-like protein
MPDRSCRADVSRKSRVFVRKGDAMKSDSHPVGLHLARELATVKRRASDGDTCENALMLAGRALDEGEPQMARELAQSVLIAARSCADHHVEARALACLAHCDRLASRLRRACDTSRRAAQLFEQLGDLGGEAQALTTLAHVSMLLGRNDEAVEAALLCVRLCERPRAEGDHGIPRLQAVLAYNCLGIAYSWSGEFVLARTALETAIQLALRCEPATSAYQPWLNQTWVETLRLVDERYRTGAIASLTRLRALVQRCSELEQDSQGVALVAGLEPATRTISAVLGALLATWSGDFEAAHAKTDAATRSLGGIMTWLDALVRWCVGELAWAQARWATAEQAFSDMKTRALAVEHEQLACTAHLLLAQVYEAQGKAEAARLEHRALRVRERRMLGESLLSRESVVSWRLDARRSQRHLKQALVASKQFERWSLEDALTGIANRRCFEQTLQERLRADGAARLTVAMIDVDRFKSVNDTYGHLVGDRVLKTVAAIIAANVRERDLPARWAGDEFVILFHDADEEVATQVRTRIETAIAEVDWSSIAPGLCLSLSIGLSAMAPGDTIDEVLQRSDESMYSTKTMDLLAY